MSGLVINHLLSPFPCGLLPYPSFAYVVNVVTPETHNKTCSQLWEPCMEQHYFWV